MGNAYLDVYAQLLNSVAPEDAALASQAIRGRS
jgi:hypothetical protein